MEKQHLEHALIDFDKKQICNGIPLSVYSGR